MVISIPSEKFNRRIGIWKGQTFTVDGEPIEREKYKEYVASVTPTAKDRAFLADVFKERDWITQKKVDDKEREWLAGPSGGDGGS